MALTWKKLKYDEVSATSRILGRKTAGAGAIEELTLSEIMDFVGSAASGDILYRGASAWARLGKGSDGQVLTLASGLPSWVSAGGGATILTAVKTADESVASSTTMQNDDHLVLAVEANSTYIFEIKLWGTAAAADRIKIGWTYPTGTTLFSYIDFNGNDSETSSGQYYVYGYGITAPAIGSWASFADWAGIWRNTSVNTNKSIEAKGILVVGGTAGNLQMQWAQQTAGGSTVLLKGSFIKLTKV